MKDPAVTSEKIYTIKREIYRIARVELAKSGKVPGVSKENIRDILGDKTLDDARASDILMLKRNGVNISSTLLSDSEDPSKDIGTNKMQV